WIVGGPHRASDMMRQSQGSCKCVRPQIRSRGAPPFVRASVARPRATRARDTMIVCCGHAASSRRGRQRNRAIMSSPFDAVLVIAFGGPQGMADVRPFLANVLKNRRVPPERVEE